MKFTSGFEVNEALPSLVTDTLTRLGANEIASYAIHGDDGHRVLMATDRGLADVTITWLRGGREVDVTCEVQPWHRVAAGVSGTVRSSMGGGTRVERGAIRFPGDPELVIDRESERGLEFDEFAAAILEHSRKP